MGVMARTLYLYNSTGFKVRKVDDELVMNADPDEQAELLHHIILTALPSAVYQRLVNLMLQGLQVNDEIIPQVFDIGK